ncbi:conserved hypothetical protein [Culex quinquefasciatus]|uniref:Uncharacterized protein n=1 Tax=Culex quinquefasciatus TaxID=7176 RepID=B0WAW2_CULQU|nr:conserved hypothetical protein [Culex quinquefasciatus]|eukprot:XP_001845846.1 conserved hypothetical protein [Culex quinquefasciatus]
MSPGPSNNATVNSSGIDKAMAMYAEIRPKQYYKLRNKEDKHGNFELKQRNESPRYTNKVDLLEKPRKIVTIDDATWLRNNRLDGSDRAQIVESATPESSAVEEESVGLVDPEVEPVATASRFILSQNLSIVKLYSNGVEADSAHRDCRRFLLEGGPDPSPDQTRFKACLATSQMEMAANGTLVSGLQNSDGPCRLLLEVVNRIGLVPNQVYRENHRSKTSSSSAAVDLDTNNIELDVKSDMCFENLMNHIKQPVRSRTFGETKSNEAAAQEVSPPGNGPSQSDLP